MKFVYSKFPIKTVYEVVVCKTQNNPAEALKGQNRLEQARATRNNLEHL